MLAFSLSMFLEHKEIRKLSESWNRFGKIETLAEFSHKKTQYEVQSFSLGNPSPGTPSLVLIGGIHGLERIGTQVALSFMSHLAARVTWDDLLQEHLKKLRVTFIPLVNPVGMHRFSRSNGNGVDLMRNAPIEATGATFGVGGQRFSRHLPWYRGNPTMDEAGMEIEAKALMKLMDTELERSPCTIALDLHSGFGVKDQLWFPYAKSREHFPNIHQVHAFSQILDEVMPNHVYVFEPQAKHYTTHGDLWDYLHIKHHNQGTFLPLTLEMGSWNWVKKNPFQIFSFLGAFNPIKPHRKKRAMRRHLPLFDFLMHATASHQVWSECDRDIHQNLALQKWYRDPIPS